MPANATSLTRWTLLAAAAALWGAGLSRDLWYDEIFRTRVMLSGDSVRTLLLHDVHNPLYNAFMAVWIALLGDREWVIRLPSLLAALATLHIVWRWSRSIWGERAAWWAVLWLAAAPPFAWYAAEAKNNMFTVFFSVWALAALDAAARERTTPRIALAMLAGALAIWTDFQSLLVLAPAWIATSVLLARLKPAPRRSASNLHDSAVLRRASPAILACLGALTLAAPLLAWKAAHPSDLSREYLGFFAPHRALWLLLVYFPSGNALLPHAGILLNLAVLAPVFATLGLLGAAALWRDPRGRVILSCIVTAMLGMYLASQVLAAIGSDLRPFQPRNMLVLLPLGAIGMAAWVGTSRSPWARRLGAAAIAVSLASSGLMRFGDTGRRDAMRPRQDYRAAAALIRTHAGDAPILVTSRYGLLPLRYYLPQASLHEVATPTELADAADAFAHSHHDAHAYFIELSGGWPPPTGEHGEWDARLSARPLGPAHGLEVLALHPRENAP